jgi:putative spermidine/putrescine transport system permease protein
MSRALDLGAMLVRLGRLAVLAAVVFWIVFLLAPLIVTIGSSLTSTEYPLFPPHGLSLRWFRQAYGYDWFVRSLGTSVVVAAASTSVSVALGLAAARVLARHRFGGRAALEALAISPLIIPSVVIGFALFHVALQLGLQDRSLMNLIVGHAVVTVPFTMRSIWTSMAALDRGVEEAALSLGAAPWATFWRVTLPSTAPGVVAGAIIAFTFSFNDVTVAVFLVGATTRTLSVELMAQMEYLPDPSPAAVSTLVMGLTLVFFVILDRTVGLDVFARK